LKKNTLFIWAVALCLIGSSACSPFKPHERSALNSDLPGTFSLYNGAAVPDQNWWRSFRDPELDRLVDIALSDNLSIHEAWARLKQARALAVQAGADRYPDLTGSADALTGRQKRSGRSSDGFEDTSLGLVSRYEIDLWGRIEAQYRAATLRVDASRLDLHTAAISVAAEVTGRWVALISQRMQKRLLLEQLRINNTLLELVQLRFNMAMVSALDVFQQKQVVEKVKAEIPLVEEREELLRHQLAVLLGKPPRTDLSVARTELPESPPLPPTGLPADLLANRPDVRAAGMRLKAADWQITEARANRLPRLSLTGRARYGEGDLDVLFDNWLLTLAGNLTAPILDGGRRAAEVDRTRALADENLARYRDTVLTAVREVEDALTSEAKQREHIAWLEKVIGTARSALEEAGVRYRNGLNDYLPVLTQLLTVQGLERDLIQRRAELLAARIRLYRALGGTWPRELVWVSDENASAAGKP
jgi:NodT family efflux transporter outer membrane factor (OMF) lipoprotein